MRLRSPITWFGGKGRMVAKLRGYLHVPHQTYVEVFGGGASLLLDRQPAPVEVYNDLDGRLTNLFAVLKDEALFPALLRRLEATPFAKMEHEAARCLSTCPAVDQVTRAAAFFTLARQAFGGMVNKPSWGVSVASTTAGQSQSTAAWTSTIKMLPEIHKRLLMVQIDNADFRKLIKHYDRAETLFYVDPPYLAQTRREGGYDHEITDQDHHDLLALLKKLEGMAFVSGYPSDLYDRELKGWSRDEFQVTVSASGNTRANGNQGPGGCQAEKFQRLEVVWVNQWLASRLPNNG